MKRSAFGAELSRDPLASRFPYNSPYAFSENRVIDAVDLEGLEEIHITKVFDGAKNKEIVPVLEFNYPGDGKGIYIESQARLKAPHLGINTSQSFIVRDERVIDEKRSVGGSLGPVNVGVSSEIEGHRGTLSIPITKGSYNFLIGVSAVTEISMESDVAKHRPRAAVSERRKQSNDE